VSNGLQICVQESGPGGRSLLPGGPEGFLHDIKSLGTDPARWSTEVVIPGN
jgi:hypothetical protein